MRALFVCLALAALTMPALAARVVDVRVGQHPTFTRIVFQLDEMRGYRLERDGDADVLVVSLDASATPESIASRGLVDRVVVEQAVGGAVARIYLKGEGAKTRVQEMILGKPARIVLDVIRTDSVAAVVPKPKARPTPKPAPEPSLPVVSKREPVEVAVTPDPEPVKVAPTPEPSLPVVSIPDPEPMKVASVTEPESADVDPSAIGTPDDMPGESGMEDASGDEPVEVATPVVPAPRPTPAKPAPPGSTESSSSGGLMENPMVMGGVVLLGLVGFMVMRKKKASEWSPEDEDASIFDAAEEEGVVAAAGGSANEPADETVGEGAKAPVPGAFSMDDLAASEPALAGTSDASPFGSSDSASEDGVISAPRPDNIVSIFDADAEVASASQGDDPMSEMMSDLPADPAGMPAAAPPPPMMSGNAGGDVARMMEAMERRMSGLESRLGEAEEAREKLERQVAAQAEELRVQRAAIARTQRALRGMNRGGDDKPSEPALRDGAQGRTRVGSA